MAFEKKTLEEYLEKIPEEYRKNLSIIGNFCGKRTKILFQFSCGCEAKQEMGAFLTRDRFDFCTSCKTKHQEIYKCNYCSTEFIKINHYEACKKKCQEKYESLILGKDYVVCQICGYHGKNLKFHVVNIHNITKQDYIKTYGSLMCSDSYDKYSESGALVGNWYNKAKEQGIDLSDFHRRVSEGVKKSIMSNPKERKRRSDLMTELNKKQQSDPEFQKKVSETAKKTSARKDIQEKRAEQLKRWRDNNPEEFHEKCIKKATTSFQSKPEIKLYEFLAALKEFCFKRNQFVHSNLISNKSSKKQLDIGDKQKRIYVEFDGVFHFKPIFGDDKLSLIQQKDSQIEEHILKHNWTLIRVSYDQYRASSTIKNKIKSDSSYFKQECLDKIIEILNSKIPGIYKIGDAYLLDGK